MEGKIFVDVHWVKDRMDQGGDNLVILDMPYGKFEYEKSYDADKRVFEDAHLPGAVEIGKIDYENKETQLNIKPADEIEAMLLSKGVDADSEVIVYSDGIIAASRTALINYWAGVKDVKIMLGGIQAWQEAGYPVETGPVEVGAKESFGAEVPGRPEAVISTPEDLMKRKEENPDLVIACMRAWDEFVGDDTGYIYIDLSGSPIGSVYAKGSTHRTNVEDLVTDEGEFGDLDQVFAEWEEWGITPDKEVAFYCGAGWRAAAAFFICLEAGWEKVRVYDGGWYQWRIYHEQDPARYPVQQGDPREELTILDS